MCKFERSIPSLGLAIVSCIEAAALQAEPLPWPDDSDDVDATVTRLVAEIELFRITDDQRAMIRFLAFQEAADVVCDGFGTDKVLLSGFLSRIISMTDEQIRRAPLESVVLRSEVMFAFGTHFGAFVAVGKADPATFCDKAAHARQDPALPARTWLPKE